MGEVFYGGDGIKERTEYNALHGERLVEKAYESIELFEDLFESSNGLETVNNSLSTDSEGVEREMALSYLVFDKDTEDVMYYNISDSSVYNRLATSTSYMKDVVLRHTTHRKGPVHEEYFVSFERKLPYINGAFFHTYMFEFAVGGGVDVTVQSNNIDVDDGVEGVVFERQLSQYDFDEFCKELAEVNAHLSAGHNERDIDRKLAKHIQ